MKAMCLWLQHIWTSQGEVQSAWQSGDKGLVTRRTTRGLWCHHFAEEGAQLLLFWVWCLAHFHSSVWQCTPLKAKNNKNTRARFQSGLKLPEQNILPLLPKNILFSKAAFLHDFTDFNEIGRISGMIFIVRLAEKYVYMWSVVVTIFKFWKAQLCPWQGQERPQVGNTSHQKEKNDQQLSWH